MTRKFCVLVLRVNYKFCFLFFFTYRPDDSDKSFDQSQIDVAFDMDANDEPINENNDYIHHEFGMYDTKKKVM